VDRRRYEVVATLGPATASLDAAHELLRAGATAFRLNTSHIAPPEAVRWMETLGPLLERAVLYLDLQGSKWRIGEIEPMALTTGARIELVLGAARAASGSLPIPHQDFFRAAALSDGRVLLDDARIELRLEEVRADRAVATVLRPGSLGARKGITLPATPFRMESLTPADLKILSGTRGCEQVRYAVSYVRDGVEMARYRSAVGSERAVAAKLERPTALEEVGSIAASCDELWLCRGDLGAELGLAGMAEAVHRFSTTVRSLPVPVLLAGQVLEHMRHHPVPTRSEVCHLYDALEHGFAGVVLSDETAIGGFPTESVHAAAMWR
jgi:pyruvate kinase